MCCGVSVQELKKLPKEMIEMYMYGRGEVSVLLAANGGAVILAHHIIIICNNA